MDRRNFERKIQEGLSPEVARNAAFLEMGGLERVKALVRQQRVGFGSHRLADATMLVAIVAFLGGVATTLALVHYNLPVSKTPILAPQTKDNLTGPPILEGTVVDETTGQPLPYVQVGLQAMRPTRRYTLTDEKGHFSFVSPSGHPYELEVFTREQEVLQRRWKLNQVHFSSPEPPAFTLVTSYGVLIKTQDGEIPSQAKPNPLRRIVINGKPILPVWPSSVDSAKRRVSLNSEPIVRLQKPTVEVKEEISWRR